MSPKDPSPGRYEPGAVLPHTFTKMKSRSSIVRNGQFWCNLYAQLQQEERTAQHSAKQSLDSGQCDNWFMQRKSTIMAKQSIGKSTIMASAVGTNLLWPHHNRKLVRLRGSSCLARPGGTIRSIPSDSYQPFRRVPSPCRSKCSEAISLQNWRGTISRYDFAVFYAKIDFLRYCTPKKIQFLQKKTPRISWNFQVPEPLVIVIWASRPTPVHLVGRYLETEGRHNHWSINYMLRIYRMLC